MKNKSRQDNKEWSGAAVLKDSVSRLIAEQRPPIRATAELPAAAAFEMAPVSGRTEAGGSTPVEVTIRLRDPAAYADPRVPLPVLRLECFFEIDGQKASVFSDRLRCPAATSDAATQDDAET